MMARVTDPIPPNADQANTGQISTGQNNINPLGNETPSSRLSTTGQLGDGTLNQIQIHPDQVDTSQRRRSSVKDWCKKRVDSAVESFIRRTRPRQQGDAIVNPYIPQPRLTQDEIAQ